MTDLQEILGSGDLEAAIADGIAAVKAKPTDAESRYRLFALMAFGGDLHRARKQLEALGLGDEQMERAKAAYINLLAAEQERRAVFHHGAEPLLPPDPPRHLQLRLQAASAEAPAAARLLEEAIGEQPDVQGTVNGEALTALRDLDDLLASVLEVFAGGRYIWLPFERISKLEIKPPGHLLDLLWLPAELTDVQSAVSQVHLPVLYEGSAAAEDPRATTGSITEWFDQDDEVLRGRGQRLLAWADGDGEVHETPVLELRSLDLDG